METAILMDFHDIDIYGVNKSIQCVLPGSTLNGGEWVAASGSSVDCSTNPLRCNVVSSVCMLDTSFQYLMMVGTSVVYPLIVQILTLTSSLLIYSVSVLIVPVHTVICY